MALIMRSTSTPARSPIAMACDVHTDQDIVVDLDDRRSSESAEI
jgi:hypothetical protein